MFKDFKKNIQVVKYVFIFCPFYILFTILYIIANTVQVLLKVILIKDIVEIVENSINNNDTTIVFKQIIIKLVIYLTIVVVATIFKTFYTNYMKGIYRQVFINKMQKLMYTKVKKIDFADFDNPEFYDMYSRALRDGTTRGIKVYEDFTTFISSMVNVFALGAFIMVSDFYLIAIVLVSIIVRIFIANKVNKNSHDLDKRTEIDRRMYGYVNRTFYQQRFAAEIKTTSIGDLLIDKCREAQKNIDREYIKTNKTNTMLNSVSTIVSNLFENGGMYIYLIYKLFRGLTISSLSSMINAANQFSSNFYTAASILTKIKVNSLYIDYFLDFMNYKPKLEDVGAKDLDEKFLTLDFKNVDFSYPNTEKLALNNINFKINQGEKIAMVGLNGAGKTTMIKLLLKFYNPNNGDIYYNNQTIRETKEDVIRKKYSIIFQDYRLYGVTIGENVLMRHMITEEDEQIVWDALKKVGLGEKISQLSDGIKTIYSREFGLDGINLSGGEQQKLAIARVFASDADIYVLDEPTSSLDPFAERDINKLLIEKSKNKTIIIIAHRLSTVVDANRIVLIEYGKIIEEGTHIELLNKQGEYYKMFMTQASLYVHEDKHRVLVGPVDEAFDE